MKPLYRGQAFNAPFTTCEPGDSVQEWRCRCRPLEQRGLREEDKACEHAGSLIPGRKSVSVNVTGTYVTIVLPLRCRLSAAAE